MIDFIRIVYDFLIELINSILLRSIDIKKIIAIICFCIVACLLVKHLLNFISIVNKKTLQQIKKFKSENKYVEDLFVELNYTKEVLRYFIYGDKWKKRLIALFNNAYDNNYGSIIKKAVVNICPMRKLYFYNTLEYINKIVETHLNLYNEDNLHDRVIQDYKDLFYVGTYTFKKYFELLNNYCHATTCKNLLLIGTAGNGKTNLLCNIAQLSIRMNNPTLLLNSKNIGGSITTYFINCLQIPHLIQKHKEWILFLYNIILNLTHKKFFIMIDAINENDNDIFKNSLAEFMNYVNKYNSFKIILTCRKEYFDCRYKNLLDNKIDYEPFIYNIKETRYYDRAIKKTFMVYKKHFKYVHDIPVPMQEKLAADLILMRIFFEVYQNSEFPVKTLNKFEIYQKYISRTNELCKNAQNILDKIIDIMLTTETYDSISMSDLDLDSDEIENFKQFADENIIISRTIKKNESTIIEEEKEVLFFVFDEFRDYCLARRIIFQCEEQKNNKYEMLFSLLSKMQISFVSPFEGIIRYAYEYFKKTNKIDYCKILLEKYANISLSRFKHRRPLFLDNDLEFSNFGLSLIFNTDFTLLNFEKSYIFQILAQPVLHDCYVCIRNLVYNELHQCGFSFSLFIEFILQIENFDIVKDMLENFCKLENNHKYISAIYYKLKKQERHINWIKLIILMYCYNQSLDKIQTIISNTEKLNDKINQIITDLKCKKLKELIIDVQKTNSLTKGA